jgi:ABC-type antimicrobial peptide transport system permease subunit
VIFNEAAIEAMGLSNPVGKIVNIWGGDREIIGVTKNFHFQSLYQSIKPCFFDFNFSNRSSKVMVKINAATTTNTIAQLEKFYKGYTGEALNYKFLDEDYQALYESENKVAALSRYFAIIAIIISCLGLFGLSAYTVVRRQKEIGVRKIVGASVASIASLLSSDFLKLVLIALAIASPFAWFALEKWLENFVYRVNLDAGIFLIAAAVTILITLSTISFEVIKAAITNPVKALRSE